ncbi:hypothetical protein OJF2_56520 [Aquisphaera giovannonii]|uniref:Uncharacterized protein n=1 Tax=Aquisphaera giovannonii TaxID=406548 RepID=A0A5B9W9F3_9BACT|nr:hypothetical protein [Aquisphaera giovannonii]QEH37067.1 hypothetical protein OJF2_56520 [Aquisphaera giovannonii]
MRRLLLADALLANPLLWVELFLLSNVAFIGVDIVLAHATNNFEHQTEWIPVAFSIGGTVVLLLGMVLGGILPAVPGVPDAVPIAPQKQVARWLGLLVGLGSVVVGVAGLIFHLEGDFFQEQPLKNLVYTAPFIAPLAYAGIGMVIILDRMVDSRTMEWARWLLLLAAGGFLGNFVLSLADHAQNGFFYPTEWVGVVAGAIAASFLIAAVIVPESRSLLVMNAAIMVIQVVVGIMGFLLHLNGNLHAPGATLRDRFIFGAPVFAPLLFADLAGLGLLGLWAQYRVLERPRETGRVVC